MPLGGFRRCRRPSLPELLNCSAHDSPVAAVAVPFALDSPPLAHLSHQKNQEKYNMTTLNNACGT